MRTVYIPTQGDFEKQVLLELDNTLTYARVREIVNHDPQVLRVQGIIFVSYVLNLSVEQCVTNILTEFNMSLHECALEGVAVLGYN